MNDAVPSEEQLERIQRGVLTRLDRRAAIARAAARGAVAVVVVGLVVGGVGLLRPGLLISGSGGGSAAGSSAERAVAVRCHASSAADSASTVVQVGSLDARRVSAACSRTGAVAYAAPNQSTRAASAAASSTPTATPAPPLDVLCTGADGTIEAFPPDGHAATLCTRNGLRPR